MENKIFDTSDSCRERLDLAYKTYTIHNNPHLEHIIVRKKLIDTLFKKLDTFCSEQLISATFELGMDQGSIYEKPSEKIDYTGDLFYAISHEICKGRESNFVYNKLGSPRVKYQSADTYSCFWLFGKYHIRAYTKRNKQVAPDSFRASTEAMNARLWWFLEIKYDDESLDSMFSVLQDLHHGLDRLESSYKQYNTSTPQLE